MRWLVPLLLLTATAYPQNNENNLPSTSVVTDSDSVRVIQGGVSKKAPAGVVRQMTSSHLTDLTKVGQGILTTSTPPLGTKYYMQVNADGTISYLDPVAFLGAIGAGSASVVIRTISGVPNIPFNILEVTDGTLTDMGGGVARLAIGSGTGGGGTWGSITGTLSNQTDLQAALNAKQPLSANLTSISSAPAYGISLLNSANAAAAQSTLSLVPGVNVQAWNTNLDDLADGSLTGSKVGSGINAGNISSGTLSTSRGGLGTDVSAYGTGLYGTISGAATNVNTFTLLRSATGITGTPDGTKFLRDDGSLAAVPGAALQVREEDGSPTVNNVTQIRVSNGGLTDNGTGSVSLNLSGGAGGGDVVSSVSVSVDGEMPLFSGTTGKQIKRSTLTGGLLQSTSGVPGIVNTSAALGSIITDKTGTNLLVYSNSPTLVSPILSGATSATTSLSSPIFSSSSPSPAGSGILRLANLDSIAWKTSGADATLLTDASRVLQSNVTFNAPTLTEGSFAVPNSTDNITFFSAATSAQWFTKISDPVGTGRVVFDTNASLTTPTFVGTQTWSDNYLYPDAPMAGTVINTSKLNNTVSVAADTTLTFSVQPSAGAVFGLKIANTDVAAHTITIPSSQSDALGGAARTTFSLAAGGKITIRWRHEGSGTYTMWGDPNVIADLGEVTTPVLANDYVEIWSAIDGAHKKVKLANLPTGSGDNVQVNAANATDANFADAVGGITWTITGASPSVIKGFVGLDAVALGTNTTGNYVASVSNGLGITGGSAGSEGAALPLGFDETGAASGDYALSANQLQFVQNGIVAEGATADSIEHFLVFSDPTGSDKTHTIPDRSGTFSQSGDTFTGNVTGTLSSSGATALTIANNVVTGAMIALGSDATGDIMYYNGTDYVRLAAGAANSTLTMTAGLPAWQNSASSTQSLTNKNLASNTNVVRAAWTVAASDETTTLTVSSGRVTFRLPYAMTLSSVRGSLTSAQSGGSVLTFDVRLAGVGSIFSTKPSFDNASRTTVGAATPAVLTTTALPDDAEITIDITQVGTGTPAGLKVSLIGTNP
jgi:hypothetical protein